MENSVSIIAYIGIGSNVGVQINNIDLAVELIDQNNNCEVEVVSSIYESSPYGVVEQNDFFNAVIKIRTDFNPKELFHFLKSVETIVGRKITSKWGPREIDLDILFYDNIVYSDDEITIPHRDLLNRDFVLVPLIEIEPNLVHPVMRKKLNEISIFKQTLEKSLSDETNTNIIRKIPHRVLV
jgi:2-amino-4-hydroxy-6-hydroxymethyldihydropteridine diphosphokinase